MKNKFSKYVLAIMLMVATLVNGVTNINANGNASITIESKMSDGTIVNSGSFNLVDSNGGVLKFDSTGSTYIYNPNGMSDALKINGSGLVTATALPQGDYTLVYNQGNAKISPELANIPIKLTDSVSSQLKLKFLKDTGNLTISFNNSDAGIASEGTKISVYNSRNQRIGFKSVDGGYEYNNFSGETTLTIKEGNGVKLMKLPVGDYTVKQISVSPELSAPLLTLSSIITKDAEETIEIKNSLVAGTLQVINKDEKGEVITGSVFVIEDLLGNVLNFSETEEGYDYNENGKTNELVHAKNSLVVEEMPSGEYILKQKSSGNDGPLSPAMKFSITAGKTSNIEARTTVSFGSIKLISLNEANEKLVGHKFEFHDEDGKKLSLTKNEDGKYSLDENGDTMVFETNENGEIEVINVPVGKYQFVEIEPLHGYLKGVANSSAIVLANKTLDVIRISKESQGIVTVFNDKNVPIKGVAVDLTKLQDATFKETFVSDDNGTFDVSSLSIGSYSMQVTAVPSPYALPDSKPLEFEITSEEFLGVQDLVIPHTTVIISNDSADKELITIVGSDFTQTYERKSPTEPITVTGLSHGTYKVYRHAFGEEITETTEFINLVVNENSKASSEPLEFGKAQSVPQSKGKGLNTKILIFALPIIIIAALLMYVFLYYIPNKKTQKDKDLEIMKFKPTSTPNTLYEKPKEITTPKIHNEFTEDGVLVKDLEEETKFPFEDEEDNYEINVFEDEEEFEDIYFESQVDSLDDVVPAVVGTNSINLKDLDSEESKEISVLEELQDPNANILLDGNVELINLPVTFIEDNEEKVVVLTEKTVEVIEEDRLEDNSQFYKSLDNTPEAEAITVFDLKTEDVKEVESIDDLKTESNDNFDLSFFDEEVPVLSEEELTKSLKINDDEDYEQED